MSGAQFRIVLDDPADLLYRSGPWLYEGAYATRPDGDLQASVDIRHDRDHDTDEFLHVQGSPQALRAFGQAFLDAADHAEAVEAELRAHHAAPDSAQAHQPQTGDPPVTGPVTTQARGRS